MLKFKLCTWIDGAEKITEYNVNENEATRFLEEVENLKKIWGIDYALEKM